jgi:repressor LexA
MLRLTDKQSEILAFVQAQIREEGKAPTRVQLAQHFGFHVNAAQCHLEALQRKGFIRLTRQSPRIEVLAP